MAPLSGDAGGQQRPARGPRLHKTDGKLGRGLKRGEPTARSHKQDGAVYAAVCELALQAAEIACHERLDVGVRTGGRQPFVLSDFRTHPRCKRDRHVRQLLAHARSCRVLVIRVGVPMQKPDRHALDPVAGQGRHGSIHGRQIQGAQHAAPCVQPLPNGQTQPTGDQRLRPVDVNVVLLETVLQGHLYGIAVPLGCQQSRSSPAALDQRVGGQRGAMQDEPRVTCLRAGTFEHGFDALHHAVGRIVVCRQYLYGDPLGPRSVGFQYHVGERSADVDGQAVARVTPGHVRRAPSDGLLETTNWSPGRVSRPPQP